MQGVSRDPRDVEGRWGGRVEVRGREGGQEWVGGGGEGGCVQKERLYQTLHCYHQNDLA